MGSGGEGWCKM